jgi:prepilin-type processing-associated H-X9-DG protein
MKATKITRHCRHGLTRIEVMFLIAIPVLFFFFVVPCSLVTLGRSQRRAMRISCASQLKQISLAMRLFANDHGGNYPWMISTNQGGSNEFTNSASVFAHFAAASNQLLTPKVLKCYLDSARASAIDFSTLSNSNISYFVSLDTRIAETNAAPSILAGDRNILGGTAMNGAVQLVRKSDKLSWSKEIHERAGNIAFTDGSVLQVEDVGLRAAMTNPAIRLAIP